MKEKFLPTCRAVLHATLPVMAGYLVMGAAFGILLADRGFGVGWALGMAVTVYSGSMQFVGVDLLYNAASLISAAMVTLLVNARYAVYGVSLLDRFSSLGKVKPLMIFWLTDETYALLCATPPEGVNKKLYTVLIAFFDHLYWIVGCVTGSLLGQVLPFSTEGIDFAMTALFVVIVVEQWQEAKDHFPALAGAGISALCLLLFGTDAFLIPSMIAISAAILLRQNIHDRREQHE